MIMTGKGEDAKAGHAESGAGFDTAALPAPRADRAVIPIGPRGLRRLVSASGWVASSAIHAALILLAALLGLAVSRPAGEPETILEVLPPPPAEPKEPSRPARRDLFTASRPEPDRPTAVEPPAVANMADADRDTKEPVEEPAELTRPAAPEEIAGGPDPAIGASLPSPSIAPQSIGVGAGASGPDSSLGQGAIRMRSSPELRLGAARAGGGGEDTESAVEKALEWLAGHQTADGSWRVSGEQAGRQGDAALQAEPRDVAASALAALAFLGAGCDGHQGRHKEAVARALEFLLAEQKPAGCWTVVPETQEMHVQGMAALALVEGYLIAPRAEGAEKLKAAAGRAVRFISDAQYPYSGWGYTPYAVRSSPEARPKPVDPRRSGNYIEQSVVIWNGMALKAARTAGIAVDGGAFSGMAQWLDDARGGDGNYAYSANFEGGRAVVRNRQSSPCMAAAALMMRLWTGGRPDERSSQLTATIVLDMLERSRAAIEAVAANAPDRSGPDLYFLHHGSIALFQMGGEKWTRWNRIMKPMVLKSQAADGSWQPSTYAPGPVIATALGALTLESYYRYSPLYR